MKSWARRFAQGLPGQRPGPYGARRVWRATCWRRACRVGCIGSSGWMRDYRPSKPVRDVVVCRPIWVSGRPPPSLPGTCSTAASRRPLPTGKWIADFTYVWTAEGWLYVAAVVDLFSRRVVGWSMSAGDDGAVRHRCTGDGDSGVVGKPDALLHHSDRGSQYTSEQFQKLMSDHGVSLFDEPLGQRLGQDRGDGELLLVAEARHRAHGTQNVSDAQTKP